MVQIKTPARQEIDRWAVVIGSRTLVTGASTSNIRQRSHVSEISDNQTVDRWILMTGTNTTTVWLDYFHLHKNSFLQSIIIGVLTSIFKIIRNECWMDECVSLVGRGNCFGHCVLQLRPPSELPVSLVGQSQNVVWSERLCSGQADPPMRRC